MKNATLLAVLVLALAGAAGAFETATVLDVEQRSGFANGLLPGDGIEVDNHKVLTVQLGDRRITARTFRMGGGTIYLANHPEALVVGSTVEAEIKRRELRVRVPDGKVLKFAIQRIEVL